MIKFKIDIIKALTDIGLNRNQLRVHDIIGQSTSQNIFDRYRLQTLSPEEIQKNDHLRDMDINKVPFPGLDTLATICLYLDCTLDDIIEIEPSSEDLVRRENVKRSLKRKGKR